MTKWIDDHAMEEHREKFRARMMAEYLKFLGTQRCEGMTEEEITTLYYTEKLKCQD